MGRAVLVQCGRGSFAQAAAALLGDVEGVRIHADGGHACGVDDLVRWNKVQGRSSQAGVDEVLYLWALNAYDWHATLIDHLVREARVREPRCIVVTGLLGPFLTERLREPERLAFVRHAVEALNRLADSCAVYCLEDFEGSSRVDAEATWMARGRLAAPCRIEVTAASFSLVPLSERRGVQDWATRRGVLPVLPGLRQ